MLQAYADAAARLVALIRDIPPEAADNPVDGLTWNVAELTAHVYTVLRRARDPRRATTVGELGALNQICVEELPSHDLRELADLIETEVALTRLLRRALPHLNRLRVGRWIRLRLHFGIEAELPMAMSWALTDMLVHGWEMARAVGVDFVVPPADAAICNVAALPQFAPWIRPDVLNQRPVQRTISFGHGLPALDMSVGDGRYGVRVDPTADPSSAVGLDPVLWLLRVSGRIEKTADEAIEDLAEWFQPI